MATSKTSSIATRFLVELLDEQGVGCDDLLAAAGVARADLASAELRTPWATFAALWQRAASVRPDVGLALCERFPEGQMHILSHLALRSESVGAGLDACCRYFSAVSAGERLQCELAGGEVAVVYSTGPAITGIPWLAEHYFALTARFLGRALGRALPVVAVELRGKRSASRDDYLLRFGVLPRFNASRNAMVLDRACLDWPMPTRDAYLSGILERVAAQHAQLAPDLPWSTRVREQLAQSLLQGRPVTLAGAAKASALGVESFRTRLGAEGLTFRKLLDDTRRALAEDHLSRGFSATSVAYLLGFSEPAAFQHACRRWFGAAAGEVRRSLRAPGGREVNLSESPG